MIGRPKFKDSYIVRYVSGEGIFLLGERESHVLEGTSLAHIVPLIDGQRTTEQIVREASEWLSPQEITSALDVLIGYGHIVEADPSMPRHFGAFWHELGVDTLLVPPVLSHTSVGVVTVGDVSGRVFCDDLRAFGLYSTVGGISSGPDMGMYVVVVDDYLQPELAEINALCLERGKPFLLVKPAGVRLWVGPLVVPGQTACWRCLDTRLRANREVHSFVERKTRQPGPIVTARARVFHAESQASKMASVQLARWLTTGRNDALESRIVIADLTTFEFTTHSVVRQPGCEVCGQPPSPLHDGSPVILKSHQAQPLSAGLRTEAPELTFDRFAHHISDVTGIVSSVVPAHWHGTGPLCGYVAGHNFALKSDQLYFLKDGLRTYSSGKGRNPSEARTSALCEALERYSGVFRGDEPRRTGRLRDMEPHAVDPRACMLFSDTQYRDRAQWLARNSRFQVVPTRFDPDAIIEWSPVSSLSNNSVRYLPTSYLYYNYPSPDEKFFCWADSNGAAAGTTLEDAIVQGIFELIERDAVAIWWYNRLECREVELSCLADPLVESMTTFYSSIGRSLWVLDITSDLGVPVYVALSHRIAGPTEDIMMGFGAHSIPEVALSRALTELNQFLPAVLNVGPDGVTAYAIQDHEAIAWWQNAKVEEHPYLAPKGVAAWPPASRDSNGDAVELVALINGLVDLLRSYDCEVLVLDQTRDDIGLPVVKVIVPGLRHFWARLAPGRLYDVPVATGALDEPLRESDLNPIPMFL
jgi:ribosomal protein S12 methylthiotransferase accessory factor